MALKMISISILLLLFAGGPSILGTRILGILPMWARSHHRFLQPVMRALAVAGHEVVVYSPFPLHNPPPNYTDVFLENITTESEELTNWFMLITQMPHYKCFDAAWYIHKTMLREFMDEPRIKQLFTSKEKFDLVITETFTSQEYTLLLSNIFKVPVIALQAFPTNNIANSQSGNSLSLSYIPGLCSPYTDKMHFSQRLLNVFTSMRDLYYYYNYLLRSMEDRIRQDFPEAPSLEELTKNVSLVFINDHLTADYAQPRPPNIIPVAGIHIQPPQRLPEDIKKFADGAKEGLILFSLGTYVRDDLEPQTYFDMYINVFKKLKQRVIWKTRKVNMEGLPENVLTVKWAPQQDVLAHPNCVLFITHGGLLSQHEAVHFGVPVIGIPQFYDQHRNVMYYEDKGVGVKIEINDLSEKTVLEAVRQVLDNPRYKENMKRLSATFRDRPLSPAESVVFWTEYVIRHGGAPHLRPASTELRWYQAAMLDALTLILTVFIVITIVLYWSIKNLFAYLFKTNRETTYDSKKHS